MNRLASDLAFLMTKKKTVPRQDEIERQIDRVDNIENRRGEEHDYPQQDVPVTDPTRVCHTAARYDRGLDARIDSRCLARTLRTKLYPIVNKA